MAFITKANSKKIIKKIDFKSVKFSGQVYRKPIYFFSYYETQELLAIQEMLENPENFFVNYYDSFKRKQSDIYVYDNNTPPAYHTNIDCERLNADFTNVLIPKEIRERGKDEILKYKEWFPNAAYLLDDPEDEMKVTIFKERCRLRFNLDIAPEIVTLKNSGAFEINNKDLRALENELDALLKKAGRFYYASRKNTAILKEFSRKTYLKNENRVIPPNSTGYSDKEIRELLTHYADEFKFPTKDLLIEWYRVKYNPNLEFNGQLLEQLGFVPCQTCLNHRIGKIVTVIENTEEVDDDDLPF